MNILGISAYYHDSAASLVRDGRIEAAAQEERFSREKHDSRFPQRAIEYCLAEAGLGYGDLDLVAFYDKPLLKFDRILETYVACAPRGFRRFMNGLPLWIRQKLHTPRELDRGLRGAFQGRYVFTQHHESHAASAFFPSPFDEAAIVTLDGVGEWATCSIGVGRGNRIQTLKELRFPHSLGLLYSAFTYLAGFKVNSGEYKLMGLAPYGEAIYRDCILEKLIDLREDGSFRVDMSYFGYCDRQVMTSSRLDRLFGGPPRRTGAPITQREMNIAASIQAVTEEIMLRIARHAHRVTGSHSLAMAGGVALNCVGNGRILREGPFENIWIQPAAGDAGGSLGAALFVWYQLLGSPRPRGGRDLQRGSLLGPRYGEDEIRELLDSAGAVYRHFEEEGKLTDAIAELIASELVVGHLQGRMEFGPRALGSRSILADARSPRIQSVLNRKIKSRESFRPFASAVLREDVADYFEMRPNEDSPYMLLVAPIREQRRIPVQDERARGLAKLAQIRSDLPAVTHVDDSTRVQTVDPARFPRLYGILESFKAKTGCSVVVNTSFNVRGEPIVCSPRDAYRCFMATGMDALVMESFLLLKRDQPAAGPLDRDTYPAEFEAD